MTSPSASFTRRNEEECIFFTSSGLGSFEQEAMMRKRKRIFIL
jgi:hypothetical protein